MSQSKSVLLEINDLKTHFYLSEGVVHAVNGASFKLYEGEILGVVGESGCGKSVMARSVMRIVPSPGRIVGGEIIYNRPRGNVREPVDLVHLGARGDTMRAIRGREISMMFQEPISSLSPVHSIGEQIIEAIRTHQACSEEAARQQAIDMLSNVGMPEPSRTIDRYPNELSGGMCQRAMIAMALSSLPCLLIADEPTTALDVTTEAQILQLLRNLQHKFGMAVMFITHNLGVIAQMAERVIVMYLGRVVEDAGVDDIFYHPLHPLYPGLAALRPAPGTAARAQTIGVNPGHSARCLWHPEGLPVSPPLFRDAARRVRLPGAVLG